MCGGRNRTWLEVHGRFDLVETKQIVIQGEMN